jgi:UDPglucose--hexose-1-phosphate uridylyltransferase
MRLQINRLLSFGLRRGLIFERDLQYSANRLLAVLGEASFAFEPVEENLESPAAILEAMLDLAAAKGLVEDTAARRDLFDALIMDCLCPRPSEVAWRFGELYKRSPEAATDYFFDLSVAANYIRKTRTDLNVSWPFESPFGRLEITINLSKPEKDPRDIAAALAAPASGYPACLLCRENEGFAGNLGHPARQNLRLVPLPDWIAQGLLGPAKRGAAAAPAADGGPEEWFMQYSPYIYYDEHSIFLNRLHIPMRIDKPTLIRLLGILDFLPHYFVGSNADLPIVGGSILTHDHYQGGCYRMPVESAEAEALYRLEGFPGVEISRVKWPLSTLRLRGAGKGELADLANLVLEAWRGYSDQSLGILADTGAPHNTVTPVARRRGTLYELDLILRNNRTTPERPYGLFHPNESLHHVKKENIGLIEAMGLAILPSRLLLELGEIERALAEGRGSLAGEPELAKHEAWYQAVLRPKAAGLSGGALKDLIRSEVGAKFLGCLLDAGVFKRDEAGLAGFERFVASLGLGRR